jgi:hypothetical protein
MAVPVLSHKTPPASNTKNLLMNTDCNPIEQQARQDRLEAAYQASGRDQLPDGSPLKSTYTGLLTKTDDDNAPAA